MRRNLIYIVAIDDPNSKFQNHDYAQYSVKSWEYYCKKNDIDLYVLRETVLDAAYKPIWNKELIQLFGQGYEKIGIVDSDTMVRWDAPNIFEITEQGGFYGVNDLCDLNWLFESINSRQKFFPDVRMNISKYINAGVIFFSEKHLYLFKELLSFYTANKEEIDAIQGGGKEQTLLNFILQKNKVDIELLDPSWNLFSIHRKNMFTNNWQLHPEFKGMCHHDEPNSYPHFMKYANIWHFTGFPIEERVRVMSTVWDLTKGRYELL